MTSANTANPMPTAGSRIRFAVLRGASNVLLGMAVGLLGYYGVTDLFAGVEQSSLREEAPAAVLRERVVAKPGSPFDFEGWEAEDADYWGDLKAGKVFGRLVAEEMDLDAVIVKGVSRADLQRGPGWITYTDLPGPTGNCGISGHRTTYGAPFRKLDRLDVGDTIDLYSPFRRYRYRVKKTFSVTPDKVEVVDSTEEPMLTLTACHPPYSAKYRLIVQSDLIEVKRLAE